MFEQYRPQSGNAGSPFQKQAFGGFGRRSSFRRSALPAMERVLPQTVTAPETDEGRQTDCIPACSLAMVYAPVQEWQTTYPVAEALRKGTLFPDLDKPFCGRTLLGR